MIYEYDCVVFDVFL